MTLTLCLCTVVTVDARRKKNVQATTRSSKTIKSEQKQTTREIAETQQKIKENQKQTRQGVEQLAGLDAGIVRQKNQISQLETRIDSLETAIVRTTDSISTIKESIKGMQEDLKTTLRAVRERRKSVNAITFVFSSPDFSTALKRMGYMDRINQYRAKKIRSLQAQTKLLQHRESNLKSLKDRQESARSQLAAARQTLEQQRNRQQAVVNKLQKEKTTLNQVLTQKQQRLANLSRELDRVIAEEQRRIENEQRKARERAEAAKREAERKKAAQAKQNSGSNNHENTANSSQKAEKETPVANNVAANKSVKAKTSSDNALTGIAEENRKLEGSFTANRGKLLFPVSGKYSIVGNFGRSEHQSLSNVKVNNSGIDIAAGKGSWARAVYEGTVSSIFHMPGYGNVVILRHGQYLTVYAGLGSLSVSKGATVKAGAKLGVLLADEDNPDRTMLHFEVRHEREKLNPLDWVK